MEKIDKILVPIDFSGCSEAALSYAVFLAVQLKAAILLTHVMNPAGHVDFPSIYPLVDAELRNGLGQALERTADRWRRDGIAFETHLLNGDPADEIGRAARMLECDLIVMGTHGRKGVVHFLMGSVAERVIRSAPVPVVTVRQKRQRERVRKEEESFVGIRKGRSAFTGGGAG